MSSLPSEHHTTRKPGRRRLRLVLGIGAAVAGIVLLVGCRTLGYYGHVARGQADLMASRQSIAELIDDPHTDPDLREQLQPIQQARAFASDRLGLPRNRSYTLYSALDRPFVTWNVFAAEEFSVEPLLHCFPFAGCVGYRGYFRRERAEQEAARLGAQGYETYVGGVRAYSTLGWFDDPVLSSMLSDQQDRLVGTIFHELAHQKLYLQGDTPFNESFATFVQQQGLREWRASQGMAPADPAEVDYRPMIERILALRERLAAIYAQPIADSVKREQKGAAIEAFRADYQQWRSAEGQGRGGYDEWVSAPIDNAKLLPFGLYDRWVPAFTALFAQVGGDWPAFHQRSAALAALDAAPRLAALDALLGAAAGMRAAAAR